MIRVERFKAAHFDSLRGEKAAESVAPFLSKEMLEKVEQAPYSYTGFLENKVLFCAGVSEYWPGRAETWTILSDATAKHMLPVTRVVRKFLSECPVKRIETSVELDYEKGHRWARLLGFEMEAHCLKAYLPNGKDVSLYSRVRQ